MESETQEMKAMDEEQAIAAAREALGADDVTVQHGNGHDGIGWYAWHSEYPEEGSICLTVPDLRPGADDA